jgi:RNA polymerase sigma-70 factor (ECF subfamily)
MMTDQALVSRVLGGDVTAFKKLIKQHERLVSFMVGKLVKNTEDHEEVCQDVFVRVYEKLGDFNFESKLSTWIATIAYRYAINAVRKGRHEMQTLAEETAGYYFVDREDPESILSDDDMDKYVLSLIDQMTPQYKIVLTLYHVEGKHYDEISTITGMPEGTVKSYLFRARALLKDKVKTYLQ